MLNKILTALSNPIKVFQVIKRTIRSKWYVLKYQHILKKADFGRNFIADGVLSITGPGFVVFGDNIRIGMTVTPWTYDKDAVISIGNNTFLNGTRFACAKQINIGNDCLIADCRIMDTDFHGVDPNNRHNPEPPEPIDIKDNVWITIQCVVLKGITIGTGSTVTPNSVVTSPIGINRIVGGNPAKTIKNI